MDLVNKILFEAVAVTDAKTLVSKVSGMWPDPKRSTIKAVPSQFGKTKETAKVLARIHNEDFNLIPKLLDNIKKENWFPSFMFVNSQPDAGIAYSDSNLKKIMESCSSVIIVIQRLYDQEDEQERVLWHVTPIEYLKTIQSEGLKPRTLNTLDTHPERVYFITKKIGAQQIWAVARMLFEKAKNVTKKLRGEYAWLEINLTKHPEIKLYDDPDMNHAYYTDVPPECIKLLGTKDIN
jgi:hypothetical protein